MDSNGLRFRMLANAGDWRLDDPLVIRYDERRRSLSLAAVREAVDFPSTGDPEVLLAVTPQTADAFGGRAFWSAAAQRVLAVAEGAGLTEPVEIAEFGPGEEPTGLAMGYDGILYAAVAGRIVWIDRRDRWQPASATLPGFTAFRLAARPEGGIWILDRTNRRIGVAEGQPISEALASPESDETFERCATNADPPRLRDVTAAGPAEESPVAIAASGAGRLALLSQDAAGQSRVRILRDDGEFGPPIALTGARNAFSIAWLDEATVAVLIGGLTEAPAYRIGDSAESLPLGDLYPLRGHDGGPFLHTLNLPPRYPTPSGSAALHRLPLRIHARTGAAANAPALDSGSAQTVWHRIYLEASIPEHCGIRVFLAATPSPDTEVPDSDWFEHRFGAALGRARDVPSGAWVSKPSEVPFHPGLTGCERVANRSGLFTALVQRAGRRVRSLTGRYLRVRVELTGDGRQTPELWALRAYSSRFSYRDRYLPELYRETEFGPAADSQAASTASDFLERFLGAFESILTPLEDRIASSYLLTDARTVPEESLDWLASWVGLTFDSALPSPARREMLRAAPRLAARRGTLRGLQLALDIVTGGAVSGGEIVVLEDFRLRRTFATILGARLEPEKDPVLGGIGVSGNSFVGDTLFLGEDHRKEFLAIFGAGLQTIASQAEIEAVAEFLRRLSDRATILVHEQMSPRDLGLIRRIVELEAPAHIVTRVVTASAPFMVELHSLVGVDTYLGGRPPRRPVRLDSTRIGRGDVVQRPPVLDPRVESSQPAEDSR